MTPEITAIIGAIFGAIPGLLSAVIVYRRSSAKLKIQTDAAESKLATERANVEKTRLEAQAAYEKEISGTQQQTNLINAIIEQGRGAKELAESVRQIAGSIDKNTNATNDLKEVVDRNSRKTIKLDENVDDFGARLVKATNVMEQSNADIQAAKNQIEASGKETQANSSTLANTILEQIAELKQITTETRAIVKDIDERVQRLETKPEPIPPPPIPPIAAVTIESKTADTPPEEKLNG